MRKRLFIVLIVVLGGVTSCKFFKSKEATSESENKIDVVYPITENVKDRAKTNTEAKLSSSAPSNLLLDAPKSSRYLLSTAAQLAENKWLTFDFNKDGQEEKILLGRDTPNGVRVLAERNNIAQNLINDITEGYFFDDYGELKPQYSIQVTLIDINQNNQREVIISIGKNGERIDSFIFILQDSSQGSFRYVGTLKGTHRAEIDSKQIRIPGKDGKKNVYQLRNNELVKVD